MLIPIWRTRVRTQWYADTRVGRTRMTVEGRRQEVRLRVLHSGRRSCPIHVPAYCRAYFDKPEDAAELGYTFGDLCPFCAREDDLPDDIRVQRLAEQITGSLRLPPTLEPTVVGKLAGVLRDFAPLRAVRIPR